MTEPVDQIQALGLWPEAEAVARQLSALPSGEYRDKAICRFTDAMVLAAIAIRHSQAAKEQIS